MPDPNQPWNKFSCRSCGVAISREGRLCATCYRETGTVATLRLLILQETDDCIEWPLGKDGNGYGQTFSDGKQIRAPRLSYILSNGEIDEDLHVLHSCDNPSCVNPRHLHTGTHYENMMEAKERGRSPRGEKHFNAKLTTDQVQEIRALAGKMTHKRIGSLYGVNETCIQRIIARKRWAHV